MRFVSYLPRLIRIPPHPPHSLASCTRTCTCTYTRRPYPSQVLMLYVWQSGMVAWLFTVSVFASMRKNMLSPVLYIVWTAGIDLTLIAGKTPAVESRQSHRLIRPRDRIDLDDWIVRGRVKTEQGRVSRHRAQSTDKRRTPIITTLTHAATGC